MDSLHEGSRSYILDENLRIPNSLISTIPNCINSTRLNKHGSRDAWVIDSCKDFDSVLVTKDIRMTITALNEGVTVMWVDEKNKRIKYIQPLVTDSKYPELEAFLKAKLKW